MDSEKQALMHSTYRQFMEIGFGDGDAGVLRQIVDENIAGFGTAIDEKIKGLAEIIQLLAIQKEQGKGFDLSWKLVPFAHYTTADEDTAVFADDVYLTLKAGEETIDMYIRFSVVLNYADGQWKVIHWHGSKPEQVESGSDTWGVDVWKQKAEELESLVQEKTADLLHKNRELEIESALERVRARSMAMRSSEELLEVIKVISEQLLQLNFRFGFVTFGFVLPDGALDFWMAAPGFPQPERIHMPYTNNPITETVLEARKQGLSFMEHFFEQEVTLVWMQQMFVHNPDSQIMTGSKPLIETSPGLYRASVLMEDIQVFMGNFGMKPYTPEQHQVLIRFARAFEQSYTRFLDLQKAEAQAREAQIEAALERVRARSLAMRSSEELTEVISLLLDQIRKLDIPAEHAGFYIDYKQRDDWHIWLADPNQIPREFTVPYFDCLVWHNYNKAKEQGLDAFACTYSFEEKNDFYEKMFRLFPIPDEARTFYMQCPGLSVSTVLLDTVGLYVENFSGTPYSEEENRIVKRFGNVFQQTYTRFLDLQKAEEQTREAEIQLALERVRARAMAMHSSQELKEVVHELRKQMGMLGQTNLETCVIHLHDESAGYIQSWAGISPPDSGGDILETNARVPKKGLLIIEEALAAYAAKRKEYVIRNEGEKLAQWFSFLEQASPDGYRKLSDSAHGDIEELTSYWSFADFDGGSLLMVTRDEPDEQTRVLLRRFSQVFGLAYRRFADLKHAEAQAREAQIEAALERVRSRSMSMRDSRELGEVAKVMFSQMKMLGGELFAFGIVLCDHDKNVVEQWHGIGEGDMMTPFQVPIDLDYIHRYRYDQWKAGSELFSIEIPSDYIARHFELMFELPSVKVLLDDLKAKGIELAHPTWEIDYGASFRNGYLLVSSLQPFTENKIFPRFAKVFEQAYTRFLDLQKAEAQAREALVERSLERIRAHVTSMQKSSDLFDIVVSMRNEFISLGHEADYFWHMRWEPEYYGLSMTSEDGSRLGMVINVPKFVHEAIPRLIEWEHSDSPVLVLPLNADEAWNYVDQMNTYGSFEQIDPHAPTEEDIRHIGGLTFVIARTTHGEIGFSLAGEVHDPPKAALDLLVRFAGVFDLAYKRFEDLKEAEKRNRETQIELALERVRSRTMAMQHSNELSETAAEVFSQLQLLGIHPWSCGFNIINQSENSISQWVSSGDGRILPPFTSPSDQDVFVRFTEAFRQGESLYVEEMGGEALEAHYRYLTSIPAIGKIAEDMKSAGIQFPGFQVFNLAYFKYGYLMFITYEQVPAFQEIFTRFARVFEQTYTRFLDLQKAEAQAREAQIEAALERVRAKAMAMHNTADLTSTAIIAFSELKKLGFSPMRSGISIQNRENRKNLLYSATSLEEGETLSIVGWAILDHHPVLREIYDRWLLGEDFYPELHGDLLRSYYEQVSSTFKVPVEQTLHSQYGYFMHFTFGIFYGWCSQPVTEDEKKLLRRFAAVIDLTFKRYFDLQKAETQAREAQIEAALERVRSKTMAMHNSQEVGESVATLFDELISLGVLHPDERCGIGIMHPDHRMEAWTAAKTADGKAELTIGHLDMTLHPLLLSAYQGWVEKKESNQYVLEGDDKIRYHEAMLSQPQYKIKRDYYSGPVRIIHSDFYFKEGCLYVFSQRELSPESLNIYARFATVFGQTYRRYQDLRKAEAQAREAQIEAALESVRSKAMAMRTSEDIAETTAASFTELKKLGISSFRSGVGIIHKASRMAQVFADTRAEDGQTTALSTMRSMDEHPALQQQYIAWEKQEDFEQFLSGDELISYYSHPFFQKSNIDLQKKDEHSQECGYYFAFPDGLFYSWSYEPYTESEKNILRRFRNIISLTFRRYLDLQKAEAQAREATKQASLDRVRAVIASMRGAEDLELITPLIFKELTILGVPFIRCGVFIIHEDRQIIDAYLSSPTGESLGALHLPFDASELTMETVKAWRKEQVHRQHWNQEDFIAWTRQMMEQHQIESSRTYQGADSAPESLDLHFVPFSQGMLYVGSLKALDDQELELVLALAKSFSIAYARYEDFVKLETAKASIESTLTELRATQAQLIQQEKLASLGQLTAGIAHEIQNPLNFVNNFSEINAELSEEILDAAAKGDIEEVKALATDIKSNQEKIREHGKRADSIVKGMLQHSRSSAGSKEPTDLAALADEYLRLAYHGMRAKDKSFNATLKTEFDPQLPLVPVVSQDISRVLLNLFNNAFYAVHERKKSEGDGYEPEVRVSIRKDDTRPDPSILITVSDNGPGIPESIREKIFQPFFTTKPTGQGTGLGLSLSYDIVKAHGGALTAETRTDEGSVFFITLPLGQ